MYKWHMCASASIVCERRKLGGSVYEARYAILVDDVWSTVCDFWEVWIWEV